MTAVLLVLGVYLIYNWETGKSLTGIFLPPSFRLYLEEKEECTLSVEGIVNSMDTGSFLLKCDENYGLICVYWNEEAIKELTIGSRICISGNASLYKRAANPGEFSLRDYYDLKGIYFRVKANSVQVLEKKTVSIRTMLYSLRLRLQEIILKNAEKEDTGVFLSLALGDRSELSEDIKDEFGNFGLLHMLTVSGLHISLLGLSILRLSRKIGLKRGFELLPGSFTVLLYFFLTGASMPAFRAVIVFFMKIISGLVKRSFDSLEAFSLAVILIIVECPGYVLTSGFLYMSAAALTFSPILPLIRKYLMHTGKRYTFLLSASVLQCMLLPVTLLQQYTCSLWTPLMNMLALPLLGLLLSSVLMGTLCGLLNTEISVFFYGTAHYVVKYYRMLMELFEKLPFSRIVNGYPEKNGLYLYLSLILCVTVYFRISYIRRKKVPEALLKRVSDRKKHYVLAGTVMLWILGLFLLRAESVREGIRIIHAYIGQGDFSYIETADGFSILVDCGSSSDTSAYENIAEPLLFYYGTDKLDYVFLSHSDQDHVNAYTALIRAGKIRTGNLILPAVLNAEDQYREVLEAFQENLPQVFYAAKGDILRLGKTEVSFLWPERKAELEGNDSSLVFLLENGQFTELYTGDISAETEALIFLSEKVDVLKVPHHGSRYSSTEDFLNRLSPKVSVVSAGINNLYGHPHEDTIERLENAGSLVLNTASSGAVEIRSGESGFSLNTFLQEE